MKINFVPIICIVFLTLFLLVVVPTTNTPKGDIGEINSDTTVIDVTVNIDTTITTIQH